MSQIYYKNTPIINEINNKINTNNIQMEYIKPTDGTVTIYSKSNCSRCNKLLKELTDNKVIIVNCDKYNDTKENHALFTVFINSLLGTTNFMYPLIFENTKQVDYDTYYNKITAFTNIDNN